MASTSMTAAAKGTTGKGGPKGGADTLDRNGQGAAIGATAARVPLFVRTPDGGHREPALPELASIVAGHLLAATGNDAVAFLSRLEKAIPSVWAKQPTPEAHGVLAVTPLTHVPAKPAPAAKPAPHPAVVKAVQAPQGAATPKAEPKVAVADMTHEQRCELAGLPARTMGWQVNDRLEAMGLLAPKAAPAPTVAAETAAAVVALATVAAVATPAPAPWTADIKALRTLCRDAGIRDKAVLAFGATMAAALVAAGKMGAVPAPVAKPEPIAPTVTAPVVAAEPAPAPKANPARPAAQHTTVWDALKLIAKDAGVALKGGKFAIMAALVDGGFMLPASKTCKEAVRATLTASFEAMKAAGLLENADVMAAFDLLDTTVQAAFKALAGK